jgi:hypothetical protein
VDPFALAMLGLLVGLVLLLVLAGKYAPGTGLEQIGWKSAREVMERREALDAEDVEQMIAARNARRRARGEREVSLEEIELQVFAELGEQQRRNEEVTAEQRERQLADRDLDELLEATNARRRARGLPERTRDEARREFGADSDRAPGSGS